MSARREPLRSQAGERRTKRELLANDDRARYECGCGGAEEFLGRDQKGVAKIRCTECGAIKRRF